MKPFISTLLTFAPAIALVASSLAAAPADDPAFTTALQRFMLATQGDSAAVEPAAEAFVALAAAHPGDPVLLAYAGAATAQCATTTMLPWKKLHAVDDGLDRIDQALMLLGPRNDAPAQAGVPGVLTTRFTAASTFLALPSTFHRHERGQKLLAEVLASPLFEGAPLAFRGAVWLRAGLAAQADHKPEEAHRLWQRVVDQQAPQAAEAQRHLQDPTQ